ncbi:vacuolar membrane-associated protein iml1 [Xylographa opegraphella]|nr:vacuolar membrane-associated protein iml1 [Xylographa opegraphella]
MSAQTLPFTSSGALPIPPREGLPGFQLRYAGSESNSRAFIKADGNLSNESVTSNPATLQDTQHPPISLVCILGIHDDGFSTDDILLNASLFPSGSLPLGTPMQLRALEAESPNRSFKQNGTNDVRRRRPSGKTRVSPSILIENNVGIARTHMKGPQEVFYVFKARDTSSETTSKHPNLEVSVSQQIATALNFKHRNQVVLTKVNEQDFLASHVEITFRDAYLTRADMWRLVVSELANQSMYKGQKLIFMGTIKAQVKTIYMNGHKVQSAFFGASTKPIFRSESARYVLFIQMSKEMWDFDTDGTGEIMFHKVINGFLPDLFKRWESIGAHHLVSIILFTRLEYDKRLAPRFAEAIIHENENELHFKTNNLAFQDFYRVLVSDMASGQWSNILTQLKKEFKVFLRDVSIRTASSAEKSSLGQDSVPKGAQDIIAGRPTAATQGNILEAISLASSQFSYDYIDRDLVRTGLSIVVISPGTGIFEVDHDMLTTTTNALIENGVGIDLVCLSPIPLHSVPLFKYVVQEEAERNKDMIICEQHPVRRLVRSWGTSHGVSAIQLGPSEESIQHESKLKSGATLPQWHYAIPHWIDISFWNSQSTHERSSREVRDSSQQKNLEIFESKSFVPRVRMYEVQMMGIMENEMGDISIPHLSPFLSLPRASKWNATRAQTDSQSSFSTASTKRSSQGFRTQFSRSESVSSSVSAARSPSFEAPASTHEDIFQWMDHYDEHVFSHPYAYKRTEGQRETASFYSVNTNRGRPQNIKSGSLTSSILPKNLSNADEGRVGKRAQLQVPRPSLDGHGIRAPESTGNFNKPHKRTNLSRQISFGLRGFGGPAPKAIPVTEISSTNAQSGSLLGRELRQQQSSPRDKDPSLVDSDGGDNILTSSTSADPNNKLTQPQSSDPKDTAKPIVIKLQRDPRIAPRSIVTLEENHIPVGSVTDDNASGEEAHKANSRHDGGQFISSATAPWLTVLNPSNPRRTLEDSANRLGRWHHVFPRSMRASNIKWKSLCSPAAVPLTTEDFPSEELLKTEYTSMEYQVSAPTDNELFEDKSPNEWLSRDLISSRFSHGFQMVVGPRVRAVTGDSSTMDTLLFVNTDVGSNGNIFYMSKGSVIHKLSVVDEGVIVKEYARGATNGLGHGIQECKPIPYAPAVRTTLSDHYNVRKFVISTSLERYDWKRLDTFIAGHEEQQLKRYPDSLQFWRARFVLIPKERPIANKKIPYLSNEDNAEEIRLEGIRKLTQLWQRSRYIPPDERRFQASSRRRKDLNPLDIIYQTRNPSAIVTAELNGTLLSEGDGTDSKPAQLLPESELFERTNLNLASIANAIQGDHGVTMMDRRWHWRLHYNCFIGMELTTWILNTFRDVDTREEAVTLGNELMKEGLFQHVERRHALRDGNFFYQICSEYRVPRPDSRSSWFGSRRSDRSVPSTPITEVIKSSPIGIRSRANSITGGSSDGDSSTPTRKQTLGVALSKRLIYDVDPRKRSYRREVITLHYDRIASADDCYHLRIDWMSATPKLIEDTIVQWATLAERNGLRLVELPIGEASRINDLHPFRSPYMVKLIKSPPNIQPQTYFDAVSLGPRAVTSWPYHKAILKKFNFVLDLEAAKDFPPTVDVTYSWGKPDYQYPQYISRDGIVLAQITDEGDFLLLANRLYTKRSATMKETGRLLPNGPDELNYTPQRMPARGIDSPSASPAMRATPDVGCVVTSGEIVTPETVAYELEAFCQDVKVLEAFYEEVLQKKAASGPATPLMESTTSGLAAPPAFTLRDVSPAARLETIAERRKFRAEKGTSETA